MSVGAGRRSRTAAGVACLVATAALAACRDAPSEPKAAVRPATEVVVASFNFPESVLLAELYARAIEAAGIPVRREVELGPRELVHPALLGGHLDVVPEYLGTALASVPAGPEAPVAGTAGRERLARALVAWNVDVLEPAEAQNQNGVVVTRSTAEHFGLSTVSDLAKVAGQMTIGGPPECPQRRYCLPGLEGLYGLRFAAFLPFDTERQRAAALDDGVVDAAVMFTTDGRLAAGDLVLLRDDRALQPQENVVPVVSKRSVAQYGSRLVDAINAVSARMSSNGLRFLNWRVAIAEKDVATEARGWLERQSLIPQAG